MNTTLPPMTRAEWEALPEVVRYFHPWERACQPLEITAAKRKADE